MQAGWRNTRPSERVLGDHGKDEKAHDAAGHEPGRQPERLGLQTDEQASASSLSPVGLS